MAKTSNLYARIESFDVKMPAARPIDASTLSDTQMDAELERGYADMQVGRTKPVKSAFADIRKYFGPQGRS